jgi:hypothetical protein
MAKEYGWGPNEILKTPLQRLFQLVRCQARDNGASAYAPKQDALRSKWLEEINRRGINGNL